MSAVDRLVQRVRRLPEQLALARARVAAIGDDPTHTTPELTRWRARVRELEAEARDYGFHDLLQVPAAIPAVGQARRAVCPLPGPSRHPLSQDDTMPNDAWRLDLHLDTVLRCVMVTATIGASDVAHKEPVIRLTRPGVREAVERMVSRHGLPSGIVTDHGTAWSGLGREIGVPHWTPSAPAAASTARVAS